jgi:hypothetical protein
MAVDKDAENAARALKLAIWAAQDEDDTETLDWLRYEVDHMVEFFGREV